MIENEEVLNLVNTSGFPFQLRVEKEISGITTRHPWTVVASEHHWALPGTNKSGYIDLIVGYGNIRLVIECKRASESNWIFLVTDTSNLDVDVLRCYHAASRSRSAHNAGEYSWVDDIVKPGSPQASFCVVRGQNEKDQPMLERIAGGLLDSVEGFAREEVYLANVKNSATRLHRAYVPVIVTAAEIHVGKFDPVGVDMKTGKLSAIDSETVPMVRFRKGMGEHRDIVLDEYDVQHANKAKERTVLVIHASELTTVMSKWEWRS